MLEEVIRCFHYLFGMILGLKRVFCQITAGPYSSCVDTDFCLVYSAALKVGDTRGELDAELKKLGQVVNTLSAKGKYPPWNSFEKAEDTTYSLPSGIDIRWRVYEEALQASKTRQATSPPTSYF